MTRGGAIETQSANDYNHNCSQLLTNLSNIDKSKGSYGSSAGTNTQQVNLSAEMNSPIPSKQLIIPQHVTINEFSPEWDYVTGGSKVLICFTP